MVPNASIRFRACSNYIQPIYLHMGPLTAKNVAFKNQEKGEGRGANALTNKPLALVERPRVETRVESF